MTTHPIRALAIIGTAMILLLLPGSVAAHAELLEATPAADSTVAGTPDELSATFSESLLPDGSTFSIRNDAGERLAVGRIDPADAVRLIIDPVPDLTPGSYEMRWQAATDDGHIERGTWTFRVEAATATPSPTPAGASASAPASTTPSASADPTPEPTPVTTPTPSGPIVPSDDPAVDTSQVFLPIIAAFAVVLIAAALLLSRRSRPSGPA
jgi:methionine-rich copper-binding protein CopC